tara:strand:- start:68 stop:670 length:603 start_codon:yes stop_codon:yes gene_type:complete
MFNLTHINATPVVVETSCYKVTDSFVDKVKSYDKKGAVHNSMSVDTYVLKNSFFSDLEKIIDNKVENYKTNVLQIRNHLKKQNSWFAYTQKGEKHHTHAHPGAFLSAVFYIKSNSGQLEFTRPRSTIQEAFYLNYDIIEYNAYNCTSWKMPLKTGDLVIFPGQVRHGSTETDDEERIILGVNYAISGKTGYDETVDFLEL